MQAVPASNGLAFVPITPCPRYALCRRSSLQVALYELGHRPVEEHVLGLVVVAEPLFDLLARGRLADPQIAIARRTQCIAQPAQHVAHRAPAFDVARSESANFRLAGVVVVPELNARAVEEGNEQSVDRGRPLEAALGQSQLGDNERMQQPRQIRARRHAHAGERLFNRASAADARPALEHKHALARARQVRRARQAIVPRADDRSHPSGAWPIRGRERASPISPRTAAVGEFTADSIYRGALGWEADINLLIGAVRP